LVVYSSYVLSLSIVYSSYVLSLSSERT
jgi:hypothetical protein